jgi:predicted dehydrogenase
MEKVRVGIIGCGGIATSKHMPSLAKVKNVEMVAFCDIIVEKAQKAALKNQKYRSLHYIDEDDYDELPEVKTAEEPKKSGSPMLGAQDLPNIKD